MSRTMPREFSREPAEDPDDIEVEAINYGATPPMESLCRPVSVSLERLTVKKKNLVRHVKPSPWSMGYIKRRKRKRKTHDISRGNQTAEKESGQNFLPMRKRKSLVTEVPVKNTIEYAAKSQSLMASDERTPLEEPEPEQDISENVKQPVVKLRKMSVKMNEADELSGSVSITTRKAAPLSKREKKKETEEASHSNQNEVSHSEETVALEDIKLSLRCRGSNNSSEWKFKRKRTISSDRTSIDSEIPTKLRKQGSSQYDSTTTLSLSEASNDTKVSTNSSREWSLSSASTNSTTSMHVLNEEMEFRHLRNRALSYNYSDKRMTRSSRTKLLKNSETTMGVENNNNSQTTVIEKQDRRRKTNKHSEPKGSLVPKQTGRHVQKVREHSSHSNTTPRLSVLLTRLEDMSDDTYLINWRKNTRKEVSGFREATSKVSDNNMEVSEILSQAPLDLDTVADEEDIMSSASCIEDVVLRLEDDEHVDVQEPPSMPEQMQAIPNQLLEREGNVEKSYELLIDPRVLLFKLEALGITFDNVVSASKVEELTQQHIEFLINSDLRDADRSVLAKLLRRRIDEPLENNDEQSLNKPGNQVALVSSSAVCVRNSFDEFEDTDKTSGTSEDDCRLSDSSDSRRNASENQWDNICTPKRVGRTVMMVRIPMASPSKHSPNFDQFFKREMDTTPSKNPSTSAQDISSEEESDKVSENEQDLSDASTIANFPITAQQTTPKKSVHEERSSTSPVIGSQYANTSCDVSVRTPPRRLTPMKSDALSPRRLPSSASSSCTMKGNETPVLSPSKEKPSSQVASAQKVPHHSTPEKNSTGLIADKSAPKSVGPHKRLMFGMLALNHARPRIETITPPRNVSMIKKRIDYTISQRVDRDATRATDSQNRRLTSDSTDVSGTSKSPVLGMKARSQDPVIVKRTFSPKKSADGNLLNASIRRQSTHKSLIKEDSSSHPDTPTAVYKCILCDLTFQDYSVLQKHLPSHSEKRNLEPLSTPGDSSKVVDTPQEKQHETPKSSTDNSSAAPKAAESAQKSPAADQKATEQAEPSASHPPSANDTSCKVVSSSPDGKSKDEVTPSKQQSSDALKEKRSKLRRVRRLPRMSDRTDCSICLKDFKTKDDLANHIYTHTENELQMAYALAKIKMHLLETPPVEENETQEAATVVVEATTKESEAEATVEENAKDASDSATTINLTQSEDPIQPTCGNENSSQASSAMTIPVETNRGETAETKPAEEAEKAVAIPTAASQNKVVQVTKPISVCECHKKELIIKNSLKIEVVLLCHICRVLFRSMECFETHYRLPEHTLCNQNRRNGRSPKLFCVTCGMIFSSVQDVRQHLEVHARSNRNDRTDFRCKICKVIFLGIGSLFYVHWSNHMKNSFFLASRLSFPKTSIVGTKLVPPTFNSSDATESYLQVAEHVCSKCKTPFGVEEDLKKHEAKCTEIVNVKALSAAPSASVEVKKVRLLCSICEEVYHTLSEFQQHVRSKHYKRSKPQYICVSLTAVKRMYICNVCAETFSEMKEFEEHWTKHDILCQGYVCLRCSKEYKYWGTFLSHSQTHKTGTEIDPPFCKAVYKNVKYQCGICKVMFNSPALLGAHLVTHSKALPATEDAVDEKTSEEVAPSSNTKVVANISVLKQPTPNQGKNISSHKVYTNPMIAKNQINQQEGQKVQVQKKMLNFAGGSSIPAGEPKKISDVIQQSPIKRQDVLKSPSKPTLQPKVAELDVNSIKVSSTTNSNAVLKPENPGPSDVTAKVVDVDSLQSKAANSACDADAAAGSSNTTVSKENSPPKPRRGFLRVKTLAELTARAVVHACTECTLTFESPSDLAQHVLIHDTPVDDDTAVLTETLLNNVKLPHPTTSMEAKNNVVVKTAPVNAVAQTTAQPRPRPPVKTRIVPNVTVYSVSSSPPVRKTVQTKGNEIQQYRVVQKNKKELQPLSKVNPSTSVASSSATTAVYHKNLPACNITRPSPGTRCPPKAPQRILPKKAVTFVPLASRSVPMPVQQSFLLYTPKARVASPQLASTSAAKLTPIQSANCNPVPSTSGQTKPTVRKGRKYVCALCPEFRYDTVAGYLNHEVTEEHIERKKSYIQDRIDLSNAEDQSVVKTPAPAQHTEPLASNSSNTSFTYRHPIFPNRGVLYVNVDSTANEVATSNFTGKYQSQILQQRLQQQPQVQQQPQPQQLRQQPQPQQQQQLRQQAQVQQQQEPQQLRPPPEYQQQPRVQEQQLQSQMQQQQQLRQQPQPQQLRQQQQTQQQQLRQQSQVQQQQESQQLRPPPEYPQQPPVQEQQQQSQMQQQKQLQLNQQQQQRQLEQQQQIQLEQQQQQIQLEQQQQQIQLEQQQQLQLEQQQQIQLEQQQQIQLGQQQQQIQLVQQQEEQQQVFEPQVYHQPYLQEAYMDWAVQPPVYTKGNDELNNPCYGQQILINPAAVNNVYPTPTMTLQYQQPEGTSTAQQAVMYMCSYCTKNVRFFSEDRLQQHLNIEHNYLCDICGLRLFTVNDLDVHKISCMWQANTYQGNIQ